jgi:hypothetical protein
MPLLDVIHPEGAFSPEARDELLRTQRIHVPAPALAPH